MKNKLLLTMGFALLFGCPLIAEENPANKSSEPNSPTSSQENVISYQFEPTNGASNQRKKIFFSSNTDTPRKIGDTPVYLRVDVKPNGDKSCVYQDLNNNKTLDSGEPYGQIGSRAMCLKIQKGGKTFPYWINVEYCVENHLVVSSNTIFAADNGTSKLNVADNNLNGILDRGDLFELNGNGQWLQMLDSIILGKKQYKLEILPDTYALNMIPAKDSLLKTTLQNAGDNQFKLNLILRHKKTALTISLQSGQEAHLPPGEYNITFAQFAMLDDKKEWIAISGRQDTMEGVVTIKENQDNVIELPTPKTITFSLKQKSNGSFEVRNPKLLGHYGEIYQPLHLGGSFTDRANHYPKAYIIYDDGTEKYYAPMSYG